MPLPEISNEQKLTYIYHSLKAQEARRKRAAWFRGLKWIIVLGIVYFIVSYPGYIFTKASELIRPIVMDQAQTLLDENKASITKGLNNVMKNIRDLVTEINTSENLPATNSTDVKSKTATGTTKTPTTGTGAKKPAK